MKLKKAARVLGLVVISLAVLGAYLATSYVLGGEFLVRIKGSDTPAFIDRVMQRERNFPKYTFWNYKEGAGGGLNDVYPPLTQTVIVRLSKVSDLGIISWVKILGWLSIPLFAWGIYLFVLIRLRVWVVGFLAGFFYILSPIAYSWLYGWGFFAESVAMIWFPFFMLAVDFWLKQRLEKGKGFKERIYFGLAALILALTLLSHPMVCLGSVMFMGVYGVGLALWSKKERKARLKKAIGGVAMLFGVAIWLAAFWLVPYQAYNRVADQGRSPGWGMKVEGVYYNDLDWKQVLSFIPQEVMDSDTLRHRNYSFPWALAWLLPVGTVMAVVLKRKRLVIAFGTAVLMLSMGLSTEVMAFFTQLPILTYLNNWRTLGYPGRVLIPVMAAWGIYGVVYGVIFPFKFIKKRWWLRGIRTLVVTGVVLVVAGGWLWYWRHQPGEAKDRINYAREMSDCDVWQTYHPDFCKEGPVGIVTQLQDREKWMRPLSKIREENIMSPEIESYLGEIPGGDFWRMHVTPKGGWARMTAPFMSKNTIMHNYDNYGILMTTLYAVQDGNLLYFGDDLTYADRRATPAIANWFGLKYLLLNKEKEPIDELKEVGFREEGKGPGELVLLALEGAEPIVSIDSRPRILVIDRDDPDVRIYDLVFRKALFNMIDYDRAMLIHGKDYISDYTIEELKQFEMVWLYGYEYKGKGEKEKDRQKAWGLLDEYVREGGRLFIDTGWQFTAADWQVNQTAGFFPTTDLEWNKLGKVKEYELAGDLIEIEGVDTGKFRPLIWEDQDWGVSTSERLKDWARPILSAKGKPLIAGGEYGEGRVVWSGMNILNHIDGYDWDNEEVKLMKRVVEWLLVGYGRDKLVWEQDYTGERINPDRVEFVINRYMPESYGLYFKEAFHPYWQAKLVSGDKKERLEIYKAGPEYKYVFLPEVKVGDKIVLEVKLPWWYRSLRLVSAVGLVWLLVYVFKPEWLPKDWLEKVWRGWKKRLRKAWEDEEE